jgi:protein-L-isoaspartate O-methyltransferase
MFTLAHLREKAARSLFCGYRVCDCVQVLRPGDAVIDAGAGFGVSALVFSKVVGSSGSVHAFEAQRVLSQLVCSNAATNQVRVATTIDNFVGCNLVVICALAGIQHPLH